ncbi:hypothetical protein COV17_00810 [Candidatus Woesearchaeota archaeon CG10_big_fil_rev_8_21_14_0_10_36_11]|nr:MAG: hypothetical protein COV17_00810 [Candidatus Woesearchaeota archaeon CG10_big_fil_rev_8_21_14_0_10_36_11]
MYFLELWRKKNVIKENKKNLLLKIIKKPQQAMRLHARSTEAKEVVLRCVCYLEVVFLYKSFGCLLLIGGILNKVYKRLNETDSYDSRQLWHNSVSQWNF